MSCVDLAYISNEECIGNSLSSINGNFAALSAAVCDLSGGPSSSDLLTLINTLSTNMQNIGNYPYLEYACVTTPASAGQIIPANIITTLIINAEIADSGNFGNLSANQITLSAGTYIAEGEVTYAESTNNGANSNSGFGLYNISDSIYVTRGHPYDLAQFGTIALKTQFTIGTPKTFDLRFWTGRQVEVRSAIIWNSNNTTLTTLSADQRNTIRFWKVG